MSAKTYPRWLPPAAFVGVLGLALLLSNQTAPVDGLGPGIQNDAEYEASRAKVEELSKETVKAVDAGATPSAPDMVKLREASSLVDRLNAYNPLRADTYFLSGEIHHILGEDDVAIERFRQCVLNAPGNIASQPAQATDFKEMAAEANYRLSLLLLVGRDVKGAYETANAAVEAVPISSLYLTARASAENELRRVSDARKDLALALKIDPSNRRAATLLRFISHP